MICLGNARVIKSLNLQGHSTINMDDGGMLGIYPSPNLYHGEFYLAARSVTAKINIGKRVYINNNATIIADKTTIFIYDTPLIDPNFIYFDSTFHSLYAAKRLSRDYRCKPVTIGRNVFLVANGDTFCKVSPLVITM